MGFFFIFLFLSNKALSQIGNDYWFYGVLGGIKFTPSSLQPDTNNLGVSTLSSFIAQSDTVPFLFYGSAGAVYDRNHDTMPNGNMYPFNSGNTLSCTYLGIPLNSAQSKFTLFHLNDVDTTGNPPAFNLRYSTLDMTLNNGLGDIDTNDRNQLLIDSVAAGMASVAAIGINEGKHWFATIRYDDPKVYIYLVDSNGLNLMHSSPVGGLTNGLNYTAQLQFSVSGKYFALRVGLYTVLEELLLFRFNPETGVLSDRISLPIERASGMEFSPSEEFLYVGRNIIEGVQPTSLSQFSLMNYNQTAIMNSECVFFENYAVNVWPPNIFWQLQMATNKKIYVAERSHTLAYIDNPDDPCPSINYFDSIYVPPIGTYTQGLPNVVASELFPHIRYKGNCVGKAVTFWIQPGRADSVLWDFGDPTSGVLNSQNALIGTHTFVGTPPFTITAIVYHDTFYIDTMSVVIDSFFQNPTKPDLVDTTFCEGNAVLLDAFQSGAFFLWNTGSDSSALQADSSGQYIVSVYNRCDTVSDTANIIVHLPFDLQLASDTALCADDTFELNPNLPELSSFQWSDGSGDLIRTLVATNDNGFERFTLTLVAENSCSIDSDDVVIDFYPEPSAQLPEDSNHCFSNPVVLFNQNRDSVNYVWSDGTAGNSIELNKSDTVWLEASNLCATVRDTMIIVFYPELIVELGEDTTLCNGQPFALDIKALADTYEWSTGSTEQTITVNESGIYRVTAYDPPCKAIDQIKVAFTDDCCKFFIANVITPNADGINDVLSIESDCASPKYLLSIYNRWGILVFRGSGGEWPWDGFINGQKASEGTYFYQLEYESKKLKGHLSVVH